MNYIIVTNNNKVFNFYKETDEVIFLENIIFQEVLRSVEKNIKDGHKLLSDPILYNLENSSNPFKSILISKNRYLDNNTSLELIEGAVHISQKLSPKDKELLSHDSLEEYRFVDLNLIIDSIKQLNTNKIV
ncbi:GrdX family protein [Cetobacterium sp. 2A]|uniref:GrdX family protein n=1 Tax=Cetobacterium sp. 2A TaxID=2754723 RepID=UPI00163C00EC|nr:GrdX family protein [Cetobacterium sp. 2A]MBC2856652.1 GrdX family protein [Cetobacterium sp. 2A]